MPRQDPGPGVEELAVNVILCEEVPTALKPPAPLRPTKTYVPGLNFSAAPAAIVQTGVEGPSTLSPTLTTYGMTPFRQVVFTSIVPVRTSMAFVPFPETVNPESALKLTRGSILMANPAFPEIVVVSRDGVAGVGPEKPTGLPVSVDPLTDGDPPMTRIPAT